MKIRNKIIAAMLTSAAILTAVPAAAFAAETDIVSEAFENQGQHEETADADVVNDDSKPVQDDSEEDQKLDFTVDSYHVLKPGTTEITDKVKKDELVDVVILLKDPARDMRTFDFKRYDLKRMEDYFYGDAVKAEIVTVDQQEDAGEELALQITFSGLRYKGSDQQLRFQIIDKKTGDDQKFEIEVEEAVKVDEQEEDEKKQEEKKEEEKNTKETAETADSGSDDSGSYSDSYDSYSFGSSGISYSSSSDGVKIDAAVPNIIIDQYSYGDKPVAAGESFKLKTTFRNTGKLPITNIVATINGGEVFTMDGSTNTLYFEQVDAGQTQDIKVPMQVVSGTKSGAKALELSFKYEYIDGSTRKTGSATINLSVPVTQPLRFEISDPKTDKEAEVGKELTITADFVNKGKGDIYNVEAEIVADNMEILNTKQYVGSVAPGNSGTIGFVATPQEEGTNNVTVKISYEDADQNVQTVEYPLTIDVQPAVEIIAADMQVAAAAVNPEKGFPVVPAAIAAAAAAGLGVVMVVSRKKKAAANIDFEWKDEEK
ncbi:MAG: CARDB domain-containing protein [Lachnospiraceae bacterium]|nr:CARDB domain-containing protein [Lachnospiraceae bacterium]